MTNPSFSTGTAIFVAAVVLSLSIAAASNRIDNSLRCTSVTTASPQMLRMAYKDARQRMAATPDTPAILASVRSYVGCEL